MGLAGTLALLAATVAVLFGVALTRDDEVATPVGEGAAATTRRTERSTPDELLELSLERSPAVARRVDEIRGIEFDEVPEPQVTDTEALRELAEKEVAKPKAAETIAASDAELKLLGMLEPDESLADVTTDVTADAAAYYDPKEKELFLLGDAVPAGPALTEFVLAHELNHALEDQAFGLPQVERVVGRRGAGRVGARRGIGDGAHDRVRRASTWPSPISWTRSARSTRGRPDLPAIAIAQVTFAYFGGQRFVDELRANADGGWDLVDFAYQRRLPATTEQILHPEKYLEDEGALPVPDIPDPGPGWKKVDDGTVGEFFTREILRQDAEEVGADEAAAAGWGGDRYRVLPAQGTRLLSALTTAARTMRSRSSGAATTRSEAAELRMALEDFVERSLDGVEAGEGSMGARRRGLGGRREARATSSPSRSPQMRRRPRGLARPVDPVE